MVLKLLFCHLFLENVLLVLKFLYILKNKSTVEKTDSNLKRISKIDKINNVNKINECNRTKKFVLY